MTPRNAGRLGRFLRAALGCGVALCGSMLGLQAAEPEHQGAENLEHHVRVVEKGTSSKSARKAATDRLPLDKLTDEHRQRAEQVLRTLSVFRDLPTLEFEVEPRVYEFFRAHPDVAVSIWRAMKISQFEMWQTGREEYEADAGDGSTGVVTVLYLGGPHCVVLCDGVYKSPFLAKPIKATALLHVETVYLQRADGKTYVRHGGHLFVSFPSQTVDTAAKIISPVSNLIIDRNFQEISLFLHMMSLAMARQPGWVEHLAGQLEGILEIRKGQLLDVTAQVYVNTLRRDPERAGQSELLLEQVVEPLKNSPAAAPKTRNVSAEKDASNRAAQGTERTAQDAADPNLLLRVPRSAPEAKKTAAQSKSGTAVK